MEKAKKIKITRIALVVILSVTLVLTSVYAILNLPPWKSKESSGNIEVSGINFFNTLSGDRKKVALYHPSSSINITVLDLQEKEKVATYDLYIVRSVQLSKNGESLVTYNLTELAYYNIPSTTPEWTISDQWFDNTYGTGEVISQFDVNYNESHMVVLTCNIWGGNTSYWVNLLDITSDPELVWRTYVNASVGEIDIAKEAPILGGKFTVWNQTEWTGVVYLWQFSSNETFWSFENRYLYSFSLHQDGTRLLLAISGGSRLYIVNPKLEEGKKVQEQRTYGGRGNLISLSPDWCHVASISGSYTTPTSIVLYSEETSNPIWETEVPCSERWHSLEIAVSWDGNYIAVGDCGNRSVMVFKYPEPEPIFIYYSQYTIFDLVFIDNETLVASAYDYSSRQSDLLYFDMSYAPLIPTILWIPIIQGIVSIIAIIILFIMIRRYERRNAKSED